MYLLCKNVVIVTALKCVLHRYAHCIHCTDIDRKRLIPIVVRRSSSETPISTVRCRWLRKESCGPVILSARLSSERRSTILPTNLPARNSWQLPELSFQKTVHLWSAVALEFFVACLFMCRSVRNFVVFVIGSV